MCILGSYHQILSYLLGKNYVQVVAEYLQAYIQMWGTSADSKHPIMVFNFCSATCLVKVNTQNAIKSVRRSARAHTCTYTLIKMHVHGNIVWIVHQKASPWSS